MDGQVESSYYWFTGHRLDGKGKGPRVEMNEPVLVIKHPNNLLYVYTFDGNAIPFHQYEGSFLKIEKPEANG